mmetsp:Transcript_5635/g.7576  ORF Transcript_5635/g.7576 Transcript_5635/m.7576 type:complete len:139 (+) Transcript_5635:1700-2116(+)
MQHLQLIMETLIQGFLYKQKHNKPNQKVRRFFCVVTHASNNESTLSYYKHDATSGKKSRRMPQPCGWTGSFFEVEENSASNGISQSLIINQPARTFHLTAKMLRNIFVGKRSYQRTVHMSLKIFLQKMSFQLGKKMFL